MVILAAVAETERSKQVVEIGYDLATKYDDTLAVLHVVPREEYEEHRAALKKLPGFSNFDIEQEQESAKSFAREFAVKTLSDGNSERIEPIGRVGDVANEILAEADNLDPRFLVISGRRRSPTGKAIFGNTAQRILLNAECPVVSKLSDD